MSSFFSSVNARDATCATKTIQQPERRARVKTNNNNDKRLNVCADARVNSEKLLEQKSSFLAPRICKNLSGVPLWARAASVARESFVYVCVCAFSGVTTKKRYT